MNPLNWKFSQSKKLYGTLIWNTRLISAAVMGVLTVLTFMINKNALYVSERSFALEKYKQTIELCSTFNEWYRFSEYTSHTSNEEISMSELHEVWQWEGKESRDSLWNTLPAAERIDRLQNNRAMEKLLMQFEDAMMLDRRDLLDREYFYNFFISLFKRLETTQGPSIREFITYLCDINHDSEIWCGYYYCLNTIMLPLDKKGVFSAPGGPQEDTLPQ